jgi:hypothetical protein
VTVFSAESSCYAISLLRGTGKLFRHLETRKNVHHGILAGMNVPGGHGDPVLDAGPLIDRELHIPADVAKKFVEELM